MIKSQIFLQFFVKFTILHESTYNSNDQSINYSHYFFLSLLAFLQIFQSLFIDVL